MENGQTNVEYALIVVGVSLVMVVAIIGFASGLIADANAVISGWL